MKYIPADKLIAEIEILQQRVTNNWKENPRSSIDDGFLTACSRFLEIIDSLQQEQLEATSIKGYLSRDIGGQLIFSLSPNYEDDEWMLLESKLFPEIKSVDAPHCINIIIKEIK